MQALIAGIDIAKDTLQVALQLQGQDRPVDKGRQFKNTAQGWAQLCQHLGAAKAKHQATHVQVYLEATGVYGEGICHTLAGQPDTTVHQVPPDRLAHYLRAVSNRGKTDPLDARGIARFGAHHAWPQWRPQATEVQHLRQLVQRRDGLKAMRTQLRNQQHADRYRYDCCPGGAEALAEVIKTVELALRRLAREAKALVQAHTGLCRRFRWLVSIPGVGPETALAVLAQLGEALPTDVKAWVGWLGLAPRPRDSGSSVHGRATVSPARGRVLRKLLYMAALSGVRHNPVLRAHYARLLEAGKSKKLALTACARKLAHQIYGVLRHQMPFDLARALTGHAPALIAA